MPRVLVVVAHPDDETLAIGARMARFADALFLHITDGAPQDGADARAHGFRSLDAYREARFAELRDAFASAGISDASSCRLDIPDQQAALHLAEIARTIGRHIAEFAPDAILTHAYEGGHPDHDACACAVQHAVSLSVHRRHLVRIESPFYHAGANGIETEAFLPDSNDEQRATIIHMLSEDEQRRKRERLACFRSQRETLQVFPLRRELFRIAPVYDFTQPPHPGAAFYDQHSWGITSSRFSELAAAAAEELSASAPASFTTEPAVCR